MGPKPATINDTGTGPPGEAAQQATRIASVVKSLTMKILLFSDIHGDRRALERLIENEADLYIAAGDLATWGRGLEAMGAILARRAARTWLLPGNHESVEDIDGLCRQYGMRNLHERSFVADGVTIGGLGYSNPTPFHTPGEYSEVQIEAKLAQFLDVRPLVMVCHCPPRNTPLDQIRPGVHAGSESIARFIASARPAYFFCGHIHEAAGVKTQLGETIAVNAGKHGYLLDTDTIQRD